MINRALLASLLAWLVLALAIPAAHAASSMRIFSDPATWIGGGSPLTLDESQGTFSAYAGLRGASSSVRVAFVGGPGSSQVWELEFSAPEGQPLVAGNYRAYGTGNPVLPAISVRSFASAGIGTARFTVREIVRDGNGAIQKLAIDFASLASHFPDALSGSIRFNSDLPLDAPGPVAVPGPSQSVVEGSPVALDATASYTLDGRAIASFAWTQVQGAAVTLSASDQALARFVAPAVTPGGADVVLELAVRDTAGANSTDRVTVHVYDESDPRTLLHFYTYPAPYILPGARHYTSDDARFTARSAPGQTVLDVHGNEVVHLLLRSGNAAGPLQPGTYLHAATDGPPDSTAPVFSFSTNLPYCEINDQKFTVLEAEYDVDGAIVRFAADFERDCTDVGPALVGSLRLNSAIPRTAFAPVAHVSAVARIAAGLETTLDASASANPEPGTTHFTWAQTAGPAVALDDAHAAVVHFTAPAVPPGGADLGFRVTVTNDAGLGGSRDVAVHVIAPGDPVTLIHLHDRDGKYTGDGPTRVLREWTADLTSNRLQLTAFNKMLDGVSIAATTSSSTSVNVVMIAPSAAGPLVPGEYVGADVQFDSGLKPVLGVSGYGLPQCFTNDQRFTVREAEYASNGDVVRFAADFERHCREGVPSSAEGVLFGSVRINSTIPVGPKPPSVTAHAPASADVESRPELDASASIDAQDGSLTYLWTQTAGPAAILMNPTAAKTAVRLPSATISADLGFQVLVTNEFGLSRTGTVNVHVSGHDGRRSMLIIDRGRTPAVFPRVDRFDDLDSRFDVQVGSSGAAVGLAIEIRHGFDLWMISIGGPSGQALAAGEYRDAQFWSTAGKPTLSLGGPYGFDCNFAPSSFRILEIGVTAGTLDKLALDFAVQCAGVADSVFGTLRINSKIPPTPAPAKDVLIAPAVGVGQLRLDVSGGGMSCGMSYARALPAPPGSGDVPATLPAPGVQFPYGMIVFQTANCNAGGALHFTVTYPDTVPPNSVYWKYGPTSVDPRPHWYQIPATVSGNTISFTIVDGGLGDDDLVANGIVIDAGGAGVVPGQASPPVPIPAIPVVAGAAVPVPTLALPLLGALTLLCAGFGALRLRRR